MQILDDMLHFLETGGLVLFPIGVTAFVLATLIIERYWYFYQEFPKQLERDVMEWGRRKEKSSWQAMRIRETLIAVAKENLGHTMLMIRMLVALCPLLGLLGTVTGMMAVFDVIGMLGTGNVRAMASGIYTATIPTMAGMIVALPGLYFKVALQREINSRVEKLTDRLSLS
jgi:biopolymer transport protein ExbB